MLSVILTKVLTRKKGHKEPVTLYFRFSSSRERSERLDIALSRSNGLSGERVHDLERSTANHVLKRSAELQAYSGSLQRTAISVFLQAGLTSAQRVLALKRTADLQGEIPCRCITG